MDYFELISRRKSTRKFTDEQISQDDLTKLLYAANAAPVLSQKFCDPSRFSKGSIGSGLARIYSDNIFNDYLFH